MYSQQMVEYRPRTAENLLRQMLQSMPVVMLTGPRSIGKTTLARKFSESELNLDDQQTATYLEQTNYSDLEKLQKPILIDEWQKSPAILSRIKRLVDSDNSAGQFLITGSASSIADEDIWPLVGRSAFLPVRPMSQSELRQSSSEILEAIRSGNPPQSRVVDFGKTQFIDAVAESGYASMIGVDFKLPVYSSLLRAIAENAIASEAKNLGIASNTDKLSEYFSAVSVSSSTLVSEASVLQLAGVSRPSANKYQKALKKLGLIYEVPGFSSNDFSRLKKRSKTMMADTAMMAAINGWHKARVEAKPELLGVLAENFVAQQLMPFVDAEFARLSYLRTDSGDREIDFVLELADSNLIAIEVKASESVSKNDARHIDWFEAQSSQFKLGIVFYLGSEQFPLSNNIWAVPISSLWQ